MKAFFAVAVVALLIPLKSFAAADSVTVIGQLRLGMPVQLIEKQFGDPYRVIKEDGTEHRVYAIDGPSNSYAVATFTDEWPNNAVAFQYTGEKSIPGVDLYGLTLGSSPSATRKVLGEPDAILQARNLDWERWDYEEHNYSVELSPKFGLVSIRVTGFLGYWSSRGWAESYDTYAPGSLAAALHAIKEMASMTDGQGYHLDMSPRRTLAIVTGLQKLRKATTEETKLLANWSMAQKITLPEYGYAATVWEGGRSYSVLLQSSVAEAWRNEVPNGQQVFLFTMLLGASEQEGLHPVYVVNEFSALPWRKQMKAK